jgi:hypothetical protein
LAADKGHEVAEAEWRPEVARPHRAIARAA